MTMHKQLIINRFVLPTEIIDIIKEYAFLKINKIPKNDNRYIILSTIQLKTCDMFDTTSFYVLLKIAERKYYYLVYSDFSLRIHVFG